MRPAVSSKSLPAVTKTRHWPQHQLSRSEEGSQCTTQTQDSVPYRLPRILPVSSRLAHSAPSGEIASEPSGQEQLYKMDVGGSDRIEEYLRKRKKLPGPPHTIAQLHRQDGIHMPTFQRVNIEPVFPYDKVGDCRDNTSVGRSMSRTSSQCSRDTLPLPGLRKQTANRQHGDTSNAGNKCAAWRLSPHQHKNYDVQAIRGQAGPFSRDFVIHCSTPNSWLQMKLKRQKTSP